MSKPANVSRQVCLTDDGKEFLHSEKPSRRLGKVTLGTFMPGDERTPPWQTWECEHYHGSLRQYSEGFGLGGGPYAVIGISNNDESSRHDWRDFQAIKNALVGDDWEAVELYPAEARLVDPSNRFYLFCAPAGVFNFGWSDARRVRGPVNGGPPQRPFPEGVKVE